YNRTRSKADSLAAAGARVTDSIADAVHDCDAVVTMLADDHAVEQTVFGDGGIAAALKTGAIHIGSSTISTDLARRLAAEHTQHGQQYVSAPVFGRPEAAEAKK